MLLSALEYYFLLSDCLLQHPDMEEGRQDDLCWRQAHQEGPQVDLKGMVHLIYKLYLKAVFLCVKFNGTIFFLKKVCF